MSLSDMISGATKGLGDPGSLFKNPAEGVMSEFSTMQSGLGFLSGAAGIDPSGVLSSMSGAINNINSQISSQISTIGKDLPLMIQAAKQDEIVKGVDAVISGNSADLPNVVNSMFQCSSVTEGIEKAFAPLTAAKDMVTAQMENIQNMFENSGPMSSLYSALNSIPGVVVSNGKELLNFLGNVPPLLQSQIESAISSVGSFDLGSKLSTIGSQIDDLTSTYGNMVSQAQDALDEAKKKLQGLATIELMNNESNCVQNIMDAVIDKSKIDYRALSAKEAVTEQIVSSGVLSERELPKPAAPKVALPGTEAIEVSSTVEASNIQSTSSTAPASEMCAPSPGKPVIVPYTPQQIMDFLSIVTTKRKDYENEAKLVAEWSKTEIEDWRKSVDYQGKRSRVGDVSEENPYGTTTDQAALDAWKPVVDEYLSKRETLRSKMAERDRKKQIWFDILDESKDRRLYGKFPYTYKRAQGMEVTTEHTNLDTTK